MYPITTLFPEPANSKQVTRKARGSAPSLHHVPSPRSVTRTCTRTRHCRGPDCAGPDGLVGLCGPAGPSRGDGAAATHCGGDTATPRGYITVQGTQTLCTSQQTRTVILILGF